MSQRLRERATTAFVVVSFFLAWEVASRLGLVSGLLFPPPSDSAARLVAMTVNGDLPEALLSTLWRLGRGTFIGITIGGLVGLALGTSRKAVRVADPIISALHPIPKVTVLPLALVIFGLGDVALIVIIAVGAAFPMLINVIAGARAIDPLHFTVARHHGLEGWALLRTVTLPGSMPFVLAGIRLAVNTAFHVTLAVELIFASRGLGGLLWRSWERFNLEELYATLAVVALAGVLVTTGIAAFARRLAPWQEQDR